MATASAFGFSGWDPIGTIGDAAVQGATNFAWNGKDMRRNIRYQKKMMNFQSDLNQKNQIWTARNMPKETVQGLRDAHLNPLLAFSDFSGLASSGAMGVSPSTVGGGSSAPSFSNFDSGFDSGAFDAALSLINHGSKSRKNKKKALKLADNQMDTDMEMSHVDKENKPALAQANYNSALAKAGAEMTETSNRAKEAELKAYLLNREIEATTGRWQPDRTLGMSRGTDEKNEFWTDFYQQKLDLNKWKNSAYRQYLLDGLEGANSLFNIGKDTADVISSFKKGKAADAKRVNETLKTQNKMKNIMRRKSKGLRRH